MKPKLKPFLLILAVNLSLLSPQPIQAFYNPSTGRWLNRDPISERGGQNLYSFVRNTPIANLDRLGKNTVVIDFARSSTAITAEVIGSNICPAGGVDIVFSFSTGNPDVTEWQVNNAGEFFCDGERTTIHDYTPIVEPGKTEGGEWKVTCHSKTPFCPRGRHTGHTLLAMNGAENPSGPMIKAGEVDAEWTYYCNTCCEQEGKPQIRLQRLYPRDRPKTN